MPSLFSYGTLQQPEVQRATYGRLLGGRADVLTGYRLEPIEIDDPDVVSLSGKAVHTIARPSSDPGDRITGVVFELTDAELLASDSYETDSYARIRVTLESGRLAWVYAGAPQESAD